MMALPEEELRLATLAAVERLVEQVALDAPPGLRRSLEKDRRRDEKLPSEGCIHDWTLIWSSRPFGDEPRPIEDLVPGREITRKEGRCWLVERALTEVWPDPPDMPPDDRLWFDLETAELRGGRRVFLVGACFHDGGEWRLWQALARTGAEEAAVIASFADLVRARPRLGSFSGIKNDWPLLRARWNAAGLQAPRPSDHFDLFEVADARYRLFLGSCRLLALERVFLRRIRSGDVASGVIPIVYRRFLRDRDARLIAQVLHHNLLDVISLPQLHPLVTAPADLLPGAAIDTPGITA